MEKFIQAFLPHLSLDSSSAKDPAISPYYKDLEPFRGKLPSALFTCGTDDPLLDDSVNMGTKWMVFGGEAVVKIYPGAAHGFIGFPPSVLEEAGRAVEDTKTYIRGCMAKVGAPE
jgi:acetyl esterase/lipase